MATKAASQNKGSSLDRKSLLAITAWNNAQRQLHEEMAGAIAY
jgi:hypothetical protein